MRILASLALLLPLAGAAADAAKPLATRGTASVTLADVDARAAAVPDEQRAAVFDSPQRIESFVSNLLLNRQLANEARERGYDEDPVVQREIALATEEVLARRRIAELKRDVDVDTATLAREIYLANPARFTLPERVVVRHILVDRKDGDEAAQQQIAAVEKALAAAGADFAAVARELSDDYTTKGDGGLLPEFGRDRMEKAFEEASFALAKPGDRSPRIETLYGWHWIELVKKSPAKLRPFEDVKAELEAEVLAQQGEKRAKEYVDTLRGLPIDADPEAVASLRTRYATGQHTVLRAPKPAAGR